MAMSDPGSVGLRAATSVPARSYLVATAGIVIALAVLLASWLRAPWLFELQVSARALSVPERGIETLYRRKATSVHVTGADLLHPEHFSRPGELLQAVVLGYGAAARRADRVPSWNPLVARALRLESSDDGAAAHADELADTDRRILEEWASAFPLVPDLPTRRKLAAGEIHVFLLPADSAYRAQSGLCALLPTGYETAADGNVRMLARQLATMATSPGRDCIEGVGIPYMELAAAGQSDLNAEANYAALLRAADAVADAGSLDDVVIGTWATSSSSRQSLRRAFEHAWADNREGLVRGGSGAAHESLRLACLALLAAFTGILWRREPLDASSAAALFVVVGSGLTLAFWLLTFLQPVLVDVVSDRVVLGVKAVLSVVAGWHLRRLVAYDPREILRRGLPR
jgi:hypothetical protein